MKIEQLLAAALVLLTTSFAFADIPTVVPLERDQNWMNRHLGHLELVKKGGAPIVFLGDSITEAWNHPDRGRRIWQRYFGEGPMKALNFGISAERTEHLLWRIEHGELDGYEAKLIVVAIGVNNIGQRSFEQEPPSDTIIGIKTVLDAVRRKQPKAKVVLHPIFPRASGEYGRTAESMQQRADIVNFELFKFCDGVNVFWCDFTDRLLTADGRYPSTVAPDGLHPIAIGYEIWAAEILPFARAAVAGTPMPPQRFSTRQTLSTAGFGRASVSVTPQTCFEYRDFWYGRLRDHRRAIVENKSKKFDIVFCGDSITHLWEAYGKEAYADVTNRFSVLNLGYCGDSTQHLLWRLKNGEGQGYRAKLFMVMIGTNNAGDPAKVVTAGIVNDVKTIRELHPEAKVLLLPIFPRGEKADNGYRTKNAEVSAAVKAAFADNPSVIWCDFNAKFLEPDGTLPKAMFGDFLHPNKDGYRIWYDSVLPYFEKYAK